VTHGDKEMMPADKGMTPVDKEMIDHWKPIREIMK